MNLDSRKTSNLPAPEKQFSDLNRREVLLYFIIPGIVGVALLAYAFFLKNEQMLRPVSGNAIAALNIIGGLVCGMSSLMLAITAVDKTLMRWEIASNKLLLGIIAGVAGLSGLILPFVVMAQMGSMYDRIEETALRESGRSQRFRIDQNEFSPGGKHGPYRYLYITVPDQRGIRHSLRLTAFDRQWVTDLDSLWIRYLPANPSIFESLEPEVWR